MGIRSKAKNQRERERFETVIVCTMFLRCPKYELFMYVKGQQNTNKKRPRREREREIARVNTRNREMRNTRLADYLGVKCGTRTYQRVIIIMKIRDCPIYLVLLFRFSKLLLKKKKF